MSLTAVIVDDEPLARSLLAAILGDIEDVQIVAQCKNGFEAVEAAAQHMPDMMFLDIEMPEMNGFDVIKAIQADILPKIIFTTAYAAYAVDAFAVQALNYVLKPLDDAKIRDSVDRVRLAISSAAAKTSKSTMLSVLQHSDPVPKDSALIVKESDKIAFLDKAEIDWIEADGDYVCIHSEAQTHLIRATLKSVEAQLSGFNFLRVHRSTIVNLDKLLEIRPAQKGEATIVMKAGQHLKVSRRYGTILRQKITQN